GCRTVHRHMSARDERELGRRDEPERGDPLVCRTGPRRGRLAVGIMTRATGDHKRHVARSCRNGLGRLQHGRDAFAARAADRDGREAKLVSDLAAEVAEDRVHLVNRYADLSEDTLRGLQGDRRGSMPREAPRLLRIERTGDHDALVRVTHPASPVGPVPAGPVASWAGRGAATIRSAASRAGIPTRTPSRSAAPFTMEMTPSR